MFYGTWFCHPKEILTETKSIDCYESENSKDDIFGLGIYFAYNASYPNAGYTY